jgi:hypothetical protein
MEGAIETLTSRQKAIVWYAIALTAVMMIGLAIVQDATPGKGMAAIVMRAIIGAISGPFIEAVMYVIRFWMMFDL